jgi:hypothetical protein
MSPSILIMDLVTKNERMNSSNRAELDSHTDTCVGGDTIILLHETDINVSIITYSPEYAALQDIPILPLALGLTVQKRMGPLISLFGMK